MVQVARHYPREAEFWRPQPLWAGETAFLLAGGPSLADFDVARLRDRRVIAINSSCHRVLAAGIADPVLFFTDANWYEAHTDLIADWPGMVFTVSRTAKGRMPDKLHRVDLDARDDFKPDWPTLKQGRSSGHTAISLAAALGARRHVLLGYDMRIVDGRSHHHDEYKETDPNLYARDFLAAFAGWQAAAERAGIEILNATPGSALKEFPAVDIEFVLDGR